MSKLDQLTAELQTLGFKVTGDAYRKAVKTFADDQFVAVDLMGKPGDRVEFTVESNAFGVTTQVSGVDGEKVNGTLSSLRYEVDERLAEMDHALA